MTAERKEYTNNPQSSCTRHLYYARVHLGKQNSFLFDRNSRGSHESSFYYRGYREPGCRFQCSRFSSFAKRDTRGAIIFNDDPSLPLCLDNKLGDNHHEQRSFTTRSQDAHLSFLREAKDPSVRAFSKRGFVPFFSNFDAEKKKNPGQKRWNFPDAPLRFAVACNEGKKRGKVAGPGNKKLSGCTRPAVREGQNKRKVLEQYAQCDFIPRLVRVFLPRRRAFHGLSLECRTIRARSPSSYVNPQPMC